MKTFTTSHERVDNLDSVRKGFFPTELLSQFPVLANLCQKFISPDPEKRPSAIEAIKIVTFVVVFFVKVPFQSTYINPSFCTQSFKTKNINQFR